LIAPSAETECVAVRAFRSPHERERNAGAVVPRGVHPDIASLIRATRLRGSLASFPIHNVKQRSFFVPAARCCARVLSLPLHRSPPPPNEGRAERREAVSSVVALSVKARTTFCETRPSGANRNGPLGAPTLAVLGPEPRVASAKFPPLRRARVPNLPGRGYGPRPGTPHLAPSANVSGDAPRERGWAICSRTPKCSQ
jgi:hypothetical protein